MGVSHIPLGKLSRKITPFLAPICPLHRQLFMRYKSFFRVDGMNAAEISKKVKDHAASPVNTNGIAQVTGIRK